jgi:regulator of protease activity HflC (stomatin/prohibitin superfamily)
MTPNRFDKSFSFDKKNITMILTGLIAIIVLTILSMSITIIGTGERGVVFNTFSGVEDRSLGEGMHLVLPVIQIVTKYDVKVQSRFMGGADSINSLTSDGQTVNTELSIIYYIDSDDAWKLHQEIGSEYVEKVVKPIVRSATRNVVAGFSAERLYSGTRAQLEKDILTNITTELKKYYINVNEILIRDIKFSQEFSNAIEQKQVAMQEAERMKYILDKEKKEKERKIIEAEGEAGALEERGRALRQNPQLIQYEYVRKLSPNISTVVTDQSAIINFPESLLKKQ